MWKSVNTMPTPTPTAEAGGHSPLDVEALARLAGEFFRTLPGGEPGISSAGGLPLPGNPLPPGVPSGPLPQATTTQFGGVGAAVPALNLVPSGPDQAAVRLRPSPSQFPHAVAANGLPDAPVIAVPGVDSRLGSPLLGVPQGLLQPPREHAASGYYFLDLAPQRPPRDALQAARTPVGFDLNAVRRDFPILSERVDGKPLVWFDNAATTQKPRAVIDRISHFYEHENSNIHRAAHQLAARATDAYEGARNTVARFLNARSADEVVFVRGATEGINLVAKSWGEAHLREGDEILVSHLEHHANIVPWQQLAQRKGAQLRVIPVDEDGQILLAEARRLIGPKTRLLAVTQVSNALGTVLPVQELVALAKAVGATVLIDGAQSVSHMPVDFQSLGADFFVFSGHKIFGPTGIGAVVARPEAWAASPPWQGGGNMIADVTFERTQFQPPPALFEAGTGNIADAVGLGAALQYVQRIGLPAIASYEHLLLEYATEAVRGIPGLRIIGTAAHKASVLSFVLAGHETTAVGKALADEGIAVRSGHHCAQPILRRFGVEATVRPSFAFYNTCDEIDHFVAVVKRLAGRRA